MSILAEPLEVTQLITTVLERLQIPYVVGGSLASSLHGIPRATQHIDLLADIRIHQIVSLVAALQDSFYIDADSIREAIEHSSSFNVIHLPTMFKVDVFVPSPDDTWYQQEIARKERYEIDTSTASHLFLATAEDIIIQKLYSKAILVSTGWWCIRTTMAGCLRGTPGQAVTARLFLFATTSPVKRSRCFIGTGA